MAEPFGTQDTESESLTDFLGVKSPLALQSSPALPVAGPVVGGAAPASMGGGGTVAPVAGGGGPAARTGARAGAPSASVQQALQALKMGEKAARAIGSLGQSQPTKGGGVNQDPNAPEAQQGGQSGTPPVPVPPASMDLFKDFPEEIITPEASGVDMATLGAYAPYAQAALAAAELVPNVVGRAGSKMPAGEQAALAANEAIGIAAAPWTAGLSTVVTPAFDAIISDWFGKPHKSRAESAALGNRDLSTSYSTLLQDLQSAQTPEELAAAFSQVEGEGYRDNKMPYPIAQGFDVRDRGALLAAINSGDPEALNFLWQGGGTQEAVGGANTALNNAVRQQVALMRAAQAGDPQAQALLQERLAAKQARAAKAYETSGMNPEFQRLASEAMQQQWAQGSGGGDGGAGAP